MIATAIRTGHPELWVPRWVQGMTKATGVLPRWLQERIAGAFGADRVLADRDESQRDGLRGAGASARGLTGRTPTPTGH